MKNGPLVHDAYSRWWYDKNNAPFLGISWFGVETVKSPNDLWVYQEILWRTQPELIVETGSFLGGSALYLADLCDLIGTGEVVSIDISQRGELPEHPRLEFLIGCSSTDSALLQVVRERAHGRRTMVILDSCHAKGHVLDELNAYAVFVTQGQYLIVEDTNVHGYQWASTEEMADGGPAEAVKAWQPTNKGFEVDRSCERLGFTQNPGGFLKRVR